ncbi:hypothetical protein [Phytomonospora endophytica]|uniref:Uncharacterized protein n=1 Tax=Phytomonospora endophytica TaxID=714109 RepID=A0A841FEN0_9ACTN|nr:hypothetical protein [Phytomonospora endophytica]MBB6034294.1 hypothetical protein [Phytomonospora endophytica]GIG66688.1 hypothetical protein Pen01_29830 [Phytomonospora endophytica]
MGDHFTAMGLPAGNGETFAATLARVFAEARDWTRSGRGTRTANWRDPSGAGVDLMVRSRFGRRREPCATPQFTGGGTQTVVPTAVVPDAECPGCDLLAIEVHEEGEMIYPLLVAASRPYAHRLGEPSTAHLTFVAESVETDPDPDDAFPLADRALIPIGQFSDPPTASVLATGTVTSAEVRRTRLFGVPFHHITMAGLGGDFDVVAAHGDLPHGVRAGQRLRVEGWVCGRVTT